MNRLDIILKYVKGKQESEIWMSGNSAQMLKRGFLFLKIPTNFARQTKKWCRDKREK